MADRELLIDLLKEANAETAAKIERGEIEDNEIGWEFLADHLVANGVVVQRWIPVTERLPESGEIVLCNTTYFVEVLQWDKRADAWCGQHRGYHKSYVTHWMPLPEPPMRKGENGA